MMQASDIRNAFCAPVQRPTESVSVPGMGIDVTVQGMTARERSQYDAQFRLPNGKPNRAKQLKGRALLVVACCVDDSGAKVFTADDVDTVDNLPAMTLEPIVDACLRVCGMTSADVDTAAKNSDEIDGSNS